MPNYKLLVHSIGQLVQVEACGRKVKRGEEMNQLDIMGDGGKTGYSILVDRYW